MTKKEATFLRGVVVDLLSRYHESRGLHGRLLEGSVRFRRDSVEKRNIDSEEMRKEKLFHLSKLLKLSQRTAVITDDSPSSPSLSSLPSAQHHHLVSLERSGLIQTVITLDPWSLLQKSGFPQHKIIECRGSNFNPSNPQIRDEDENNHNDIIASIQRELLDADLIVVLCPINNVFKYKSLEDLMNTVLKRSILGNQ